MHLLLLWRTYLNERLKSFILHSSSSTLICLAGISYYEMNVLILVWLAEGCAIPALFSKTVDATAEVHGPKQDTVPGSADGSCTDAWAFFRYLCTFVVDPALTDIFLFHKFCTQLAVSNISEIHPVASRFLSLSQWALAPGLSVAPYPCPVPLHFLLSFFQATVWL